MNYALYSHTYFDTVERRYDNIITINCMPVGPLSTIVTRFKNNKVSAFSLETNCGLAFKSNRHYNKLMLVDELPDLISFLSLNGYTIDTSLTKMILKTNVTSRLIAYVRVVYTIGH